MYNMEVEDVHNFAVNGGIIVHNCMDSVRYFVLTKKLNAVSRYGNKPKPEKISPAYMKG